MRGLLTVVTYCRAVALGPRASVIVALRLSCSEASGIFPDQQSNPCPLHWQTSDSIFFFFNFRLLEDNCFTKLCWPLPYINMNQPQVIMYPLPPEPPPSFPISSHPRLSQGRGWSGYEYKYFQALLRVGRGQLCLNGVIHMFTEF